MTSFKLGFAGIVAASLMFCATLPAGAVPVCNNDGNVNNGETCDNGPSILADGCDDFCQVLAGWACVNPNGSDPSVCHQIVCGDDITDGPDEDCDGEECCDSNCNFLPSSTVCRGAAGSCDIVENCTGSGANCPADDLEPSTTVCRPAVSVECDVEETCTGNDSDCPSDVLANNCDDNDGLECTVSECLGDGSCVHADTCVENCFGPGFWQNHSSTEKDGNNITQAVLDSVGGLSVCGYYVTETDDLEAGMSSAEQGLCVRTQGEPKRQLVRQLETAALNCAISEGATCEQITSRFIDVSYDDCNALCADEPVQDGPTVEECIDALSCFNKGGRYENGVCSKGTCDDDGTTECESDDDCPSEDCVRYEDSCAGGTLCTDELPDADAQICFEKKGPASSPKICNVARHDDCTTDDNYCYQSCSGPDSCVATCEATPGCDPSVACTDALPCFEACFFGPFVGAYNCGCEFAWATFCDAITNDVGDFLNCLYGYPAAEGEFCPACGQDPLSCVF